MFSAPRLGPMVFLDDLHRRGQRTGAQQQRGVGGLRRHAAADLEAPPPLAADDRRGDDLALAFSNSRMAMRLPTFSRVTSRMMRALGVDRQVDGGLASGRRSPAARR